MAANKLTKMTITCRKCIQEQQYEPLEFTATMEMTFSETDTKEEIRQVVGASRRALMAEVGACFIEYFNMRDKEAAQCQG